MALDQVIHIAKKHAQRSNEVGERTMSLGEHLEELRKRLLHSIIGVAIMSGLCFWYGKYIVVWIAQPMRLALYRNGFLGDMAAVETSGGFGVYMKVSIIASIVLASPWILWQLWKFISVGLYAAERKVVHILVPFSIVMASLGLAFSYFIVLPVTADFFVSFATSYPNPNPAEVNPITRFFLKLGNDENLGGLKSDHLQHGLPDSFLFDKNPIKLPVLKEDPQKPAPGDAWINGEEQTLKFTAAEGYVVSVKASAQHFLTPYQSLTDWIDFAAYTTLSIIAIFQIPVIMLVLGWTRMVSPDTVSKNRKYVAFGCVIVAAVVAPPDAISMIAFFIPVYALFEGGLLIMRWAHNKQQAAAEMDMEGHEGY